MFTANHSKHIQPIPILPLLRDQSKRDIWQVQAGSLHMAGSGVQKLVLECLNPEQA